MIALSTKPMLRGWLTLFLWLSVFAWALGLGGKLFEFVVVIPSWAFDPPTSLTLMPYGPRYPHNPGDFFQPLGLLALVGSAGSLVCAWRAPRPYKTLLWIPFAALLVTTVATPLLFWPMIRDLYRAGTGAAPLDAIAAHALVSRWIWLDGIRTAIGVPAFVCSVQALCDRQRAFVA